jgi:hypothetical protein
MARWHFIIPFYFGKNMYVLRKGGAPVSRKLSYLSQTVASVQRLGVDSQITIFVCDEPSRQQALTVHPEVERIDCHPEHLPLEAVKNYQTLFNTQISDNDIIGFTEDDQILYLADSVKKDILSTTERVIFSPHRWARLFFFFRRKGRPLFRLNGHRGILDNIDEQATGKEFQFNHRYAAQPNRNAAYAACWFMKGSIFRTLDFHVPEEKVALESPSFAVFESGIPVLKLILDGRQQPSLFLVDHLSGYDYNRRLIK